MKITGVLAREILDSRGNPTVEVDLKTLKGVFRAAVPSGASTGSYEAVELRDGGPRYGGKGVQIAVENVNKVIARRIKGADIRSQKDMDHFLIKLDGTPNKAKLGANAILGVSMAFARAKAADDEKELYEYINSLLFRRRKMSIPMPSCNVLNGGKHAGSSLAIQEFMIMPAKSRNFQEGIRACAEVYQALKKAVVTRYGKSAGNVGDEGGVAPQCNSASEALTIIKEAIETSGHSQEMFLALDSAASEFYKEGLYHVDGKILTPNELVNYYLRLKKDFGVVSFEDPFHEDAFDTFASLTEKLGGTQVIGDDLLVTNPERIQRGIDTRACNSLLLKLNQIGSVTESITAAEMAYNAGWTVMVSHRSGETEDSFIADFATGIGCGQIKTGAPCRSERTCKYNQLLRIEQAEPKIRYSPAIEV